ncbi:MurR/RpiR family transcriptional regulator [Pseudonocardia sp. TRM90224]|uniref:MurR/RpiR family transcriptional regulator n=1 Tax=Pseudonocardia sp. TRM90224 TaxID=2812678 RepID=UPI001E4C6454|nr:SIS domain-containing protein [Pseudonocardia sp. TRM90224]
MTRPLDSPGDRFGARLQRRSTAAALLQRVVAQETATLAATFERVQADGSLEAVARRVVAAKRRFVTGGSKSWSYASLLATDLSASLANVTLIDGTVVRAVDVLCDVRPDDILIAFSLRRYARSTVVMAEEFAAAGGTVVAIVDDPGCSVARVAAQNVVVSTDSASYADSPTAVAAVVHALATLCAASAKGARRRLARRDAVTERLAVYEPESGDR